MRPVSVCHPIRAEAVTPRDSTLQPFKGGIVKILERAQADGLTVPVIPMALPRS